MPRENKSPITSLTVAPAPADLAPESIGFTLIAAEHAYTTALTTALQGRKGTSGMTIPRLIALQALDTNPGASGADLAKLMGVTPQSTSTLVHTLAKLGWITMSHGAGRAYEHRLTGTGRRKLASAMKVCAAVDQKMSGALSHDGVEAEALSQLLTLGASALVQSAAA